MTPSGTVPRARNDFTHAAASSETWRSLGPHAVQCRSWTTPPSRSTTRASIGAAHDGHDDGSCAKNVCGLSARAGVVVQLVQSIVRRRTVTGGRRASGPLRMPRYAARCRSRRECLRYGRGAVRYVLLDRITTLQPPELAKGVKCVSLSDDIFVDHFPGHPVMPGALIVEAMAQLAGVLVEATMRERGRHDLHALLTMIDRAKFRHVVRPGDRLELEAKGLTVTEDGGQAQAWARLDGQVAAEAQLTFVFAPVTNPVVLARRREVLNVWLTGSAETP